MIYHHADAYNEQFRRTCHCGGEPEMLMDPVDDFIVRCKKCHISTHAYMKPEEAIKQWDSGNDIMPPLDLLSDNLDKNLEGPVLYMAIRGDDSVQLNQQSCDCLEVIIVTNDRIIIAEHEKYGENGSIAFGTMSSFNKEVYNLRITAPADGSIEFVKILYEEDGTIDCVKYRYGEHYLFLFADEYNLIVTKSIMDLTFEDDTPIPDYDPSVLFD